MQVTLFCGKVVMLVDQSSTLGTHVEDFCKLSCDFLMYTVIYMYTHTRTCKIKEI